MDLDGALLRTRLLSESLARLLRQKPWLCFLLPWWMLQGRNALCGHLSRHTSLDVTTLPYRADFLASLAAQKAAGRHLILMTSADPALARQVADHLGLFDEVVASTGPRSRTPRSARGLRNWIAALRIHQWAKNILGFAPLITSHEIFNPRLLWRCTLAMGLFSLCSSAMYLLNDLVDLEADRRHTTKRGRPFAAGSLPLSAGFVAIPLLLAASFAGALAISRPFALTLAVYALGALTYSLYLKKAALLDVFVLSGLLLLRVVAGQLVTGVVYSVWLLSFGFFVLLSLAFSKRCTELSRVRSGEEVLSGRGYQVADLSQINAFGVCSAFLAAVVFMLYLQSERVRELYRRPDFLWLMPPLFLYWITRAWILSSRGAIHEDPVMFVLKDRPSWWVAILAALIMVLAGAKSWSGQP